MSDATRLVREAASSASSNDDLVGDGMGMVWHGDASLDSPLDAETLDERASTQMGPGYESRRRDAN